MSDNLESNKCPSLLNDFMNDWQLRRELGDRPDEWLEMKGRGTEGISGLNESAE